MGADRRRDSMRGNSFRIVEEVEGVELRELKGVEGVELREWS